MIRTYSVAVTNRIKECVGTATELFELQQAEPIFRGVNFDAVTEARLFAGSSPEQVMEFVEAEVGLICGQTRTSRGVEGVRGNS